MDMGAKVQALSDRVDELSWNLKHLEAKHVATYAALRMVFSEWPGDAQLLGRRLVQLAKVIDEKKPVVPWPKYQQDFRTAVDDLVAALSTRPQAK